MIRKRAPVWLPLLPAAVGLAQAAEPIRFEDVTLEAGVAYTQHRLQEPPDCIFGDFCEVERMTGGAAVADVDGDGRLDLFVTRLDAPDVLFLNAGDGRFEDGTERSGLGAYDLQSNGAGFADIDNDGDPDLYVTVIGRSGDPANSRNYLFVNDGNGRFREQAVARGAHVPSFGDRYVFGVAFGDYDGDGWVDLHVTEWTHRQRSHSRLLRNEGPERPGHFRDVTDEAGVDLGGVFAFASAFRDLDGDGRQDLAVAADFGTGRLFWNQGGGHFRDGTGEAGVGTDENGMGSTIADYDGDGDPDWFVTSIWDPDRTCEFSGCNWGDSGNRLYRNEGGRRFTDATDEAGVREGDWGWGAAWFDPDNDGDLDLVMTNGVDFPVGDLDARFEVDPIRLWENDGRGGRMLEMAAPAGLTDRGSGKGLLVFDYDTDGDLDLFVVNNAAGPRLYRNEAGHRAGWLRVVARGSVSTRDGFGAVVRVTRVHGERPLRRTIGSVTHFLGQSERVAHFGLGGAETRVASVRIDWPSGAEQELRGVPPNSMVWFEEPGRGRPGRAIFLRGAPGPGRPQVRPVSRVREHREPQ